MAQSKELQLAKANYKASLRNKEMHRIERDALVNQIITGNSPKFDCIIKLSKI
jgi:hypothetical protein